jgi:hypothetical protein
VNAAPSGDAAFDERELDDKPAGSLPVEPEDVVAFYKAAYDEARKRDEAWQAMVERVAPRLTPKRVRKLERKVNDPKANLTQDEAIMWFAAVDLSKPKTFDERAWDEWYAKRVSRSLFPVPGRASRRSAVRRRRAHGRATRTRRARAPARPEPDRPLADPRRRAS